MIAAFLDLLQNRPVGKPIWTADITYWITGQKAIGKADPAWDTEAGYLQFHQELGVMPYYYYDKFWTSTPVYSAQIRTVTCTDHDRTVNRILSPAGELTQIHTYLPTSCSTGCIKPFIETEQDLDLLLYLLEHRELRPLNLADYESRRRLWETYGGLPCLGLPRSPLPSLIYEWSSIEHIAYLFLDCEDKIAAALRLMAAQEMPILQAVCDLAPPLIHFPDNLSSNNLAGYYDDWMAGGYAHRLERLHAAGIKVAVHLDGTVNPLLRKLVRSGFDAVEALTPMPGGDLSVEAIQELADNDRVILWGGVPGVMFAPPFTWHDMEEQVRRVLHSWGRRPFVLGVADQVPPDGNIDFCRRIAAML